MMLHCQDFLWMTFWVVILYDCEGVMAMARKTVEKYLGDSRAKAQAQQRQDWDVELAAKDNRRDWDRVHDTRQRKFLVAFAHTGVIQRACEYAEVPRNMYYRWMEHDQDFVFTFRETQAEAVERLEDECRRRAENGIVKVTPIYFQGRKVGERVERVYSDLLLMFLLKALKPEKYREKFEAISPDEAMQLAEASLTDEQLSRIREAVLGSGSDNADSA